jgi:hypothetical protein
MTKILNFTFFGKLYQVNEKGHIKSNGLDYFSTDWIFIGGSSHWKKNYPNISREVAFKTPELLENCYGWDIDHGNTRQWGGQYAGGIPRIKNVYITEI